MTSRWSIATITRPFSFISLQSALSNSDTVSTAHALEDGNNSFDWLAWRKILDDRMAGRSEKRRRSSAVGLSEELQLWQDYNRLGIQLSNDNGFDDTEYTELLESQGPLRTKGPSVKGPLPKVDENKIEVIDEEESFEGGSGSTSTIQAIEEEKKRQQAAKHLAKSREALKAMNPSMGVRPPPAITSQKPKVENLIKCVVVGDGSVGKTQFLISYTTNKWPSEMVPTVFDNYAVTVMIGDEPYTLALFDTAGQEDYDRLRPLSYPQTDVFVLAFAKYLPQSFENIYEKWCPEIHHHCPGVPMVLVGITGCLDGEPIDEEEATERLARRRLKPVTKEQGEQLAREIGAVKYVECNPVTQWQMKTTFDEVIIAALEPPAIPYGRRRWWSRRRS